MISRLLLFCCVFACSLGCAETTVDPDEGETAEVGFDDARADSLEPLYLRAAGMSIWAAPGIVPEEEEWVLSARTSYDLASVAATIHGAEVGARLTSARKFEVRMTAAQVAENLAETPLVVELRTRSGLVRHAMFVARARFGASSGSSKIYPWRNIKPVVVARETTFRGRLTTPADFVSLDGRNDDDSEPEMHQEDERHWIADFATWALPWAANPTEDAVAFVGEDAAGRIYSRRVPIVFEIAKLGITSESPQEAWPAPACADAVRSCVEQHDADRDDLEICGSASQVHPCLPQASDDDIEDWKPRFASAFRKHLIAYYGEHESDIAQMGGNTRPEALLIVDTRKIAEITDPDEVPSGHDLRDFRVFTHPDVIFPGSDTLWFGVFDRASGQLVEIYDFN